jgi:hypothetical protein
MPDDKKRLKKKLWDMNLILFGLVNEFATDFLYDE